MAEITESKIHNGDDRPTAPLKAIKAFCFECVGYERNGIKECDAVKCPLWCFRDGKNPYRKEKEYTEEQLKSMKERMANARNKKS